jgi:signal transduction histidine kinase
VPLVADELGRVLINLVENALYAVHARKAQAGQAYEPAIRIATRDQGNQVELRVRDNGTGIPAEIRDRIFSPFFTTKPPGKGTGLGLSLCHDIIVQANGGTLTVETEEGQFTEFAVTIPRQPLPRDAASPRKS